LAYITPQEEQMLRDAGGTGQFVNGIPAFPRQAEDQGRSNTGDWVFLVAAGAVAAAAVAAAAVDQIQVL
jgi:hypothetical protein